MHVYVYIVVTIIRFRCNFLSFIFRIHIASWLANEQLFCTIMVTLVLNVHLRLCVTVHERIITFLLITPNCMK